MKLSTCTIVQNNSQLELSLGLAALYFARMMTRMTKLRLVVIRRHHKLRSNQSVSRTDLVAQTDVSEISDATRTSLSKKSSPTATTRQSYGIDQEP